VKNEAVLQFESLTKRLSAVELEASQRRGEGAGQTKLFSIAVLVIGSLIGLGGLIMTFMKP